MPPPSNGHWQRPPSRCQTARLTWAGTWSGFAGGGSRRGFSTSPFRLAWRSRRRSSPASRISSSLARGCEWESAARAAASFSMNRRVTVTWDWVGTSGFVRMKWGFQDGVPRCGRGQGERGRRGAHGRDDRAVRRGLGRPERGGDRLRAGLGEVEEPRQDLVTVLGRQDLRELDDARHAKPTVAQWVDDLRESLDELRGSLPVERRPAREPELSLQEIEERGVPQLEPAPISVELGEAGGEIACGGHDASIACDFWSSPDARIRVRKRERVRVREMPSRAFDAREARSAAPGAAFPRAPSSRTPSDGELCQAVDAGSMREIGARRRTRSSRVTASRTRHRRFGIADTPRPPHSSLPIPFTFGLVPLAHTALRTGHP